MTIRKNLQLELEWPVEAESACLLGGFWEIPVLGELLLGGLQSPFLF